MPDDDLDLDAIRTGDVNDLRDADLRGANLQHADLWHANLRHANLRHANLRHANLWHANLRHANLRHANLWHANLRHANLRHANLWHANLRHADLQDVNLPIYERLPETGDFEAYKGCKGHVVKVRVPADAERVSSLVGPKCRAEYVEVVEILDAEGNACDVTEATSWYDGETVYCEDETVHPDDWDDNIRKECTHGIHIYPTKHEAVEAVR